MNCNNCNLEINQNFCANCGNPTVLKRIDVHYIMHEVEHLIHFERGLFYTIKELIIRPGESIRNYLYKNRIQLVKPVFFIIVTSLLYTFINQYFHIEDGYVAYSEAQQSTAGHIFKWVQDNYGYANIIMGLFITFWIKLFFRKSGYNYFELLVLLCFVMGIGMLIYSVFGILKGLTYFNQMEVGSIIAFIYSAWAIGQFFGKNKFLNYIKSFFAYLLGFLTFTLSALLIGIIIDFINK